ncbi:putative aspartate aminotransferase, cytoplasmic 2 isoform X3 [Maylandia zebra]|uniref:putative aspartate aminotransferase, cytoplasmic 2 isoform X3 n=1 Tax=Maylandia zebra TaxID=106582 RepID=UPI0006460188|nr:aspartate aminotransferase, cytoplasmic isoform X3 [Maylandia zebra]
MSRPGSSPDEKGVSQNGDPGGQCPLFTNTLNAPVSPETRLLSAFARDTQARKVDLAGREYYSEEGKPFELRLVGKIKQQLSTDPTLHPEYPSSLGLREFTRKATEVALGKHSRAIVENQVLGVQTPGFTAAVRLGAELLRCWYDLSADWCGPVYLSSPCDDSLAGIFQAAGIQEIREAVGHLLCVLKQNSVLLPVQSQADKIVRSLWARPSVGGAHVVTTVLSNSAHLVEWQGEVKHIVERCMLIRAILREKLRLLGTPGRWDHLTQQGGLFCCIGLNGEQVEFLSNRRRVYLLPGGCLNVSAINCRNLDYIAESIHLALTSSL